MNDFSEKINVAKENIALEKTQHLFRKDDEYFAIKAYSSSFLKLVEKNPSFLHSFLRNKEGFNMRKVEDTQSKSRKIGSIVHKILLEGKALSDYSPLLTKKELEIFPFILKSFFQNEVVEKIRMDIYDQEFVVQWKETKNQVDCKAKVDFLTNKGWLFELKTCSSLDWFRKQIDTYRYDLQLAWYKRGVEVALNRPVEGISIIAIETSEPYETHIFELGEGLLRRGEEGGFIHRQKVYGWKELLDLIVFNPDALRRFEDSVTVLDTDE